VLSGGETLDETTRDRVAKAVAAIPGVGGIRWADGTTFASSSTAAAEPLHCEEDVDALLRARTIRFEEGSARIDAASRELVDEVAGALRPCLGSIIAITGHTDASGPEPGNLALSRERAEAVEAALMARGIPADGLRARGRGSRSPVEGLEPTDPANRRIEFSVIATDPVRPTPVDTPGPR
jgi:OOP family OmpA-OmpF porin